MSELDLLRRLAASPELYRAALALGGEFARLLRREAGAIEAIPAEEVRSAFVRDLERLMDGLRLEERDGRRRKP
jgi:hypothetical protein